MFVIIFRDKLETDFNQFPNIENCNCSFLINKIQAIQNKQEYIDWTAEL